MAPLTWRNVNAPDLSAASDMMERASRSFRESMTGLGDVGRNIHSQRMDTGSREALMAAQQFTNSADWTSALQSGSAYGNVDPRYIDNRTLTWGADRRGTLLRDEATVQNMEMQRRADARAAASAASAASTRARAAEETSLRNQAKTMLAEAALLDASGDSQGAASLRMQAGTLTEGTGFRADVFNAQTAAVNQQNEADRLAAEQAAQKQLDQDWIDAHFANVAGDPDTLVNLAKRSNDPEYVGTTLGNAQDLLAKQEQATNEVAIVNFTDLMGSENYAEAAKVARGLKDSVRLNQALEALNQQNADADAVFVEDLPSTFSDPGEYVFNPDAPEETEASEEPAPISPVASLSSRVPRDGLGIPLIDSETTGALDALNSSGSVSDPTSPVASLGAPPQANETEQFNSVDYGIKQLNAAISELTDDPAVRDFVANTPEGQKYAQAVAQHEQDRINKENEIAANKNRKGVKPGEGLTALNATGTRLTEILDNNPTLAMLYAGRTLRSAAGPVELAELVAVELGINTDDKDALEALQNNIQGIANEAGIQYSQAAAAVLAAGGPANYRDPFLRSARHYNENRALEYAGVYANALRNPEGMQNAGVSLDQLDGEISTLTRIHSTAEEQYRIAYGRFKADPDNKELEEELSEAHANLLEATRNVVDYRLRFDDRTDALGLTQNASSPPEIGDYVTQEMVSRAEYNQYLTGSPYGDTPQITNSAGILHYDVGNTDPNAIASQNFVSDYGEFALRDYTRLPDNENLDDFFTWVARSPESQRIIFEKIQESEYNGKEFVIPPQIEEGYEQYKAENIPDSFIDDITNLGFDLSENRDLTQDLYEDESVRKVLTTWKNNQGLLSSDRAIQYNAEKAQSAIRRFVRNMDAEEDE